MRGEPQTRELDGLGPVGLSLLMAGAKAYADCPSVCRQAQAGVLQGHGASGKAGPGAARSRCRLTLPGKGPCGFVWGLWGRAGRGAGQGQLAAGVLALALREWMGGGSGQGVPGWEPRGVFCNHNMISCAEQRSRQGEAGRGLAPAAPVSLLL